MLTRYDRAVWKGYGVVSINMELPVRTWWGWRPKRMYRVLPCIVMHLHWPLRLKIAITTDLICIKFYKCTVTGVLPYFHTYLCTQRT